jgi:hypothetical protein
VQAAQQLYSQNGLNRDCANSPDIGQYSNETINQVFTDYICEYGPDTREFGAGADITQELARSHSIYLARELFYAGGGQPIERGQRFGPAEFVWAKVDILFAGSQPVRFVLDWPAMNVTDFLGSYSYKVSLTTRGTIRVWVDNPTTLESGTRIGVYDPAAQENISLEEYLKNPSLHKDAHLVSILSSKTRDQTTGTEGGGNFEETFTWEEPYQDPWACLRWYPPWPIGLTFLQIMAAGQ